jgi:hypothetical protein
MFISKLQRRKLPLIHTIFLKKYFKIYKQALRKFALNFRLYTLHYKAKNESCVFLQLAGDTYSPRLHGIGDSGSLECSYRATQLHIQRSKEDC